MEEIGILWERMEAMEVARHRDPDFGDVSEPNEEYYKEGERGDELYK